jgi:phosphopentomutase
MSTPSSDRRAIVIVLDGAGIGELPDAASYGDAGSNTLGNLARQIHLQVPTLRALGLHHLVPIGEDPRNDRTRHAVGRMAETSPGKDSVTGHWEMMGIQLERPFPVFPYGFPADVIDAFARRTGRSVIGNTVASGTAIIETLGDTHMRTGAWIVYTSADSVFQIAAHEEVVSLDELYRACEVAFELVGKGLGVGRVIARPFVGISGAFTRTSSRRDYALSPSGETLLDVMKAAGWPVVAIGKIEDLFAGRGITVAHHTKSDEQGMDVVADVMSSLDGGLIFVNLVDFDTVFGHRNDPDGYAENLERFDHRLVDLVPRRREHDLLVVTADHGNDPTTPSTDHSREYVPLLVAGPQVRRAVDLGTRSTFADLGQTLAEFFGVRPLAHGTSFLDALGIPGMKHT